MLIGLKLVSQRRSLILDEKIAWCNGRSRVGMHSFRAPDVGFPMKCVLLNTLRQAESSAVTICTDYNNSILLWLLLERVLQAQSLPLWKLLDRKPVWLMWVSMAQGFMHEPFRKNASLWSLGLYLFPPNSNVIGYSRGYFSYMTLVWKSCQFIRCHQPRHFSLSCIQISQDLQELHAGLNLPDASIPSVHITY